MVFSGPLLKFLTFVKMAHKLQSLAISEWFPGFNRPVVIAGPCSAESREQVVRTAEMLKADKRILAYRSGLWKPRTHPGDFEGVGETGLAWLREVKEKTGLPVSVEVATPRHIELCMNAGIDILWIGARTVVNPFSMNEITVALKGIDIPVMVKNPVSPDLELWIGALERLNANGIQKIAAIHRGFSAYQSKPYRNKPLWEIPIEFKRRFPDFPVLCDPSHIAGSASGVPAISKMAMALDYDGIMVESHYLPETALTDKMQQLHPDDVIKMLDRLWMEKTAVSADLSSPEIKDLRRKIDDTDKQIMKLLTKRMSLVRKIGKEKGTRNIPALQIERWKEVRENRLRLAEQLGLDREFTESFLEIVHKESLRIQVEDEDDDGVK